MQCKIQIQTCLNYGHSYLTFTQSPLPVWIRCWAAMVTGISHNLNPIKLDTEIPLANRAISDISPGFELRPKNNQDFPVTIMTAIINVLCVACRISPGSNIPFCLRLSVSDVVRHSSSRELPRATALLGLNTCDPEAVQLDLAMNLDQSQSPSLVLQSRTPTTKWAKIEHFAASTTGEHYHLNILIHTSNSQNEYANYFN